MGNKNNLEIERRFLLKRNPTENYKFAKSYSIEQFYCIGGIRVRKMRESNWDDSWLGPPKYIKAIKTAISHGVNKEIETKLSKEQFNELMITAISWISKKRYLKRANGFLWEVDVFKDMNIVIAEVELKSIKQKIIIPKFIKDNLIMEITGMKEFSNRSLSSNKRF